MHTVDGQGAPGRRSAPRASRGGDPPGSGHRRPGVGAGSARRWLRRLPERARALLNIEDGLQQIWTELLAKDHHFGPSRASEATFAGAVVDRLLQRLGDRLCRGPLREPLDADPGDDRVGTPVESIERRRPTSGPQEPLGGPSGAWTIATTPSSPRAVTSAGSRTPWRSDLDGSSRGLQGSSACGPRPARGPGVRSAGRPLRAPIRAGLQATRRIPSSPRQATEAARGRVPRGRSMSPIPVGELGA
jgi:hypothetical protein